MELKNEFQPIRDWAIARNLYEQGDPTTQFVKLGEEVGEIARNLLKGNVEEVRDGIGDAVVVLTNFAELVSIKFGVKFTIEDCINDAYQVIKDRKGRMVNGTFDRNAEPLEL